MHPTKHAVDLWEAAPRFAQASFLRLSLLPLAGLVRERKPLAAFYADLKMKDLAHEIP